MTILFFHFGQSQEIDLSGWKQDSIPLDKKLNEANHSKDDWFFKKIKDSIIIEKNKYKRIKGDSLPFPIDSVKGLRGNEYIKSVFNGYLIGQNKGEFGGGLKFVSLNNDHSYNIRLKDEKHSTRGYIFMNILKIFEWNDRIYATEGLAHMVLDRGNFLEIFYDEGEWKYTIISSLIEKPALTFKHNEFIYMITSQYILKMDKELNINQVLKSPMYWGVLYPSSIFIKGGDIYLAMRKGILIIRDFENNPQYEWYVK